MISHRTSLTTETAELLALRALAYVVGNADLGPRLLALTGLDAETLRARAGTPALLAATLDFLAANEADLITCAEAIDCTPRELAHARTHL